MRVCVGAAGGYWWWWRHDGPGSWIVCGISITHNTNMRSMSVFRSFVFILSCLVSMSPMNGISQWNKTKTTAIHLKLLFNFESFNWSMAIGRINWTYKTNFQIYAPNRTLEGAVNGGFASSVGSENNGYYLWAGDGFVYFRSFSKTMRHNCLFMTNDLLICHFIPDEYKLANK